MPVHRRPSPFVNVRFFLFLLFATLAPSSVSALPVRPQQATVGVGVGTGGPVRARVISPDVADGFGEEDGETEEREEEEEETESPPEPDSRSVMIEPRFGMNLFLRMPGRSDLVGRPGFPMPTVGLAAAYIPFWLDRRFRIGGALDWQRHTGRKRHTYLTAEGVEEKREVEIILESVPLLFEFNAFLLTKGLVRPFVGVAIGPLFARMRQTPKDPAFRYPQATFFTTSTTMALAVWAGVQFNVWRGGPFLKLRFMDANADHEHVFSSPPTLENVDQGGLSLTTGYQFEF